MPKFCPVCERVMESKYNTDEIVFTCSTCGESVPGTDQDCLILQGYVKPREIANKYDKLIHNLALDPTNKKVPRVCDKCGLDFMVQALIGADERVFYKCDCEYSAK